MCALGCSGRTVPLYNHGACASENVELALQRLIECQGHGFLPSITAVDVA